MRFGKACGAIAAATAIGAAGPAAADQYFNRIATFPVAANLPADRDAGMPTVAEIIAATLDGMTLIYTDSPQSALGLIDISDPTAPKPAGFVPLNGEPTSVTVSGGNALVGVVTSESFARPSGQLAVVDLATKQVTATCDVGGQPDSVALSPDGTVLAVVIENERDEEVNDGEIPQLPSGMLQLIPVTDGAPDCTAMKTVALTGLAEVAPEDAEPEFVDINAAGQAVITLQENNHVAIVDVNTGEVVKHFSVGAVDLSQIDTEDDGIIAPVNSQAGRKREPDAVQWIDDTRFVTANEGDYEGGSRSFTIFDTAGSVLYDAGSDLEHLAIRIGHYPDGRSDAKGTIPSRNLFVTANEEDLVEDGGARATVMVYERREGTPAYPTIVARDGIGWGALSGLAADASEPGRLYAVTDSAYSEAQILTIDADKRPAEIVSAVTVTENGAPMQKLDLEGIASRPEGGFWLASEGAPKNEMANCIIRVSAEGIVEAVIPLPDSLAAGATASGFEGVAVVGSGEEETVWVAQQREWESDEKGFVKLMSYKPASKEWGVVRYPLDAPGKGWIGLSEITALPHGRFAIIERDNQIGESARTKLLYAVSLDGVTPAAPGEPAPTLTKTLLRDLMPDLASAHGYVMDKVESFVVDAGGNAYILTDNDGVDDSSGETQFIPVELTLSN